MKEDGVMRGRVLSYDWSGTPLGAMEQWPQSLRAIVDVVLSSRFAMWMAWGPELTFLCNDSYLPTLGIKGSWALGSPAERVWAEIWPDIGPRIETVLTTATATYDEALLLFLERSGFREETYHTFSYSPLTNDGGEVAGMLCVVTEETERVIGERRIETLRDVASAWAGTNVEKEVHIAIGAQLGGNRADLPFTLTYLFDDCGTAELALSSGVGIGDPLAPHRIEVGESFPWPSAQILGRPSPYWLENLSEQSALGEIPAGSLGKAPEQAVVVPIKRQGQERPAGFLVAGINPFRKYDAAYEAFIGLIAGQIAAAVANARAYEVERKRAEALAELDRAKTEFFSNVSHEFRTPLTLMLGPLEELLAKPSSDLPASCARLVEVVHRNGLRLLKLVNSLLDFARIESGRATALYQEAALAELTAALASSFGSVAEQAGIQLEIDCPTLPEPAYVDTELWEKVVLNLISNAFKFTFEGKIRVATRVDESAFKLAVSDTGTGIPEGELSQIFQRFHRVVGAVGRTHEGTGIGLALVQEIVREHGGTIEVESKLGRGSTFTVSIPRGKTHLPADRLGTRRSYISTAIQPRAWVEEALHWTAGDGQPKPDGNADRPVIYIAEDNADMRDYLARLLEDHYIVHLFPNGEDALTAVRERPPELLLSDVMMPKMDGFELLKAIRSEETLSDVRVILLSARAGEESKVEGLNTGADDYLVKPFTTGELLARVRAHVEMSRSRKLAESRLRDAQKLESIGLLAGGVAHDFNNLLVGVIGNASLLREYFEPDAPEYGLTGEIIQAGEAAADLTRQLLAYAGKGHLMIRPVDLSALIREKRGLLRSSVPKEIELTIDLAYPLPAMEGDPTQLQQLVMNLVINGAEAIGEHCSGRICIRTLAESRNVVLTVSDSGSGMTTEVASRIFEPFFTTKFTGRGLGLAAVHGIVRSHHGSIQLKSAVGAGTTFQVTFPALPSEIPANDETAKPGRSALGRGTILVVDDELVVRKVAQTALERRGYRVLAAPGCDEAVLIMEKQGKDVDVVLLDWAMPGKNGEETLSMLNQIRPGLPVVLSSGYNQSEVAQYFPVLAGFIQKPYTVDQLTEVIRKAMDSRHL